jgi:hypothetical protein
VSRLAKLASLLLIALWLPATLHCQLEVIGLDAFFACPEQSAHEEHADQSACANDGCQLLESGQYAFSKSRIAPATLPAPVACLFACCLLQAASAEPVSEILASRQTEPLQLQRTWQFVRRAALPARAPDSLNT